MEMAKTVFPIEYAGSAKKGIPKAKARKERRWKSSPGTE
jgi:hypothetical protein